MAWTTISNALVAVGAKPFATTVQALRDNPIAIADADSGAPVNQVAWFPYNKVTNGDANTGVIYDFAVDGAAATVVSPDFVDGYEYRFRVNQLSHNSGLSRSLQFELFNQTSGSYGAAVVLATSVSGAIRWSGYIDVLAPRLSLAWTMVRSAIGDSATTGNPTTTETNYLSVHTTSQKRLRARFSLNGTGDFNLGQIYMDRRKLIV